MEYLGILEVSGGSLLLPSGAISGVVLGVGSILRFEELEGLRIFFNESMSRKQRLLLMNGLNILNKNLDKEFLTTDPDWVDYLMLSNDPFEKKVQIKTFQVNIDNIILYLIEAIEINDQINLDEKSDLLIH